MKIPLRITIAAWLSDEGFEVEEGWRWCGGGLKKLRQKKYEHSTPRQSRCPCKRVEVLPGTSKRIPSQTEVVMMTGMKRRQYGGEAMNLGPKEYLTKPIDMDSLVPQPQGDHSSAWCRRPHSAPAKRNTLPVTFDLHNPIPGLRQSHWVLLKGNGRFTGRPPERNSSGTWPLPSISDPPSLLTWNGLNKTWRRKSSIE